MKTKNGHILTFSEKMQISAILCFATCDWFCPMTSHLISKTALEDIQALPTNYRKSVALLEQLPKRGPCAFAYFCRALSASGQNHIRHKIQAEGVTWCIGLSTVLNYDGETLHLQKGRRSISITHNEWNNLITHIPKILENLDPCKDS